MIFDEKSFFQDLRQSSPPHHHNFLKTEEPFCQPQSISPMPSSMSLCSSSSSCSSSPSPQRSSQKFPSKEKLCENYKFIYKNSRNDVDKFLSKQGWTFEERARGIISIVLACSNEVQNVHNAIKITYVLLEGRQIDFLFCCFLVLLKNIFHKKMVNN